MISKNQTDFLAIMGDDFLDGVNFKEIASIKEDQIPEYLNNSIATLYG